jgi:hypothetical protein
LQETGSGVEFMTVSLCRKLALFVLLSLLDLALTRLLVVPDSEAMHEVNPVAAWWLCSWGWVGLVCFKVSMVILPASLFLAVAPHRPRLVGRLLTASCLAVSLVVLYSGYLVGSNGDALAALYRESYQGTCLDQEIAQCRQGSAFQRQLTRDLATGRYTLDEAVVRLSGYHERDYRWWTRLRRAYPRNRDAESVAALLLHDVQCACGRESRAAREADNRRPLSSTSIAPKVGIGRAPRSIGD